MVFEDLTELEQTRYSIMETVDMLPDLIRDWRDNGHDRAADLRLLAVVSGLAFGLSNKLKLEEEEEGEAEREALDIPDPTDATYEPPAYEFIDRAGKVQTRIT